MASKIESAATSLITNAVKTFKLSDVTKHKKIPYKNLYEISSQYPGFGEGFKFWRKTWPQSCYYVLSEIDFKGTRHGNAYGILYWKGAQQSTTPMRIRNGNKRGIWRYEINNATAVLDNGLSYSAAEMNAYKQFVYKTEKEIDEKEAK